MSPSLVWIKTLGLPGIGRSGPVARAASGIESANNSGRNANADRERDFMS